MLSEALQRNAKHEARLSNISGPFLLWIISEFDPRFFVSLKMTKAIEGSKRSPRITDVSWGKLEVEGEPEPYKDAKLFSGGSCEWNWRETGTAHRPGIQIADVQERSKTRTPSIVISMKMHLTSLLIIVAVFIGLASAGPNAHAATITVSNTNDSGAGSLRQALADASDGDTIDFSVTGTILLNSDQLTVDKSVTISGPGANVLTVKSAGLFRVLTVNSGRTVTISGLTVTNGHLSGVNQGAGIFNSGTLTVTDCTISNNTANDNGGGIRNDGSLTVSGSTFTGNTSRRWRRHKQHWAIPPQQQHHQRKPLNR